MFPVKERPFKSLWRRGTTITLRKNKEAAWERRARRGGGEKGFSRGVESPAGSKAPVSPSRSKASSLYLAERKQSVIFLRVLSVEWQRLSCRGEKEDRESKDLLLEDTVCEWKTRAHSVAVLGQKWNASHAWGFIYTQVWSTRLLSKWEILFSTLLGTFHILTQDMQGLHVDFATELFKQH